MLPFSSLTDDDFAALLATLPEALEAEPSTFCVDESYHDHLRSHPEEMVRVMWWPDAQIKIGNCPLCQATLAVDGSL